MSKKKKVITAILFITLAAFVILVICKVFLSNTAESLTERYADWSKENDFEPVEPEESVEESDVMVPDEFVELQLPEDAEEEAVPPIVYADIAIGSIFDVANEVDGILTLGISLSDDAKMVAQYFIDEGWYFIITELGVSDEDEHLPEIVKRTGVQVYYSIVCEDADYTAVIVDGKIEYEKDIYEE